MYVHFKEDNANMYHTVCTVSMFKYILIFRKSQLHGFEVLTTRKGTSLFESFTSPSRGQASSFAADWPCQVSHNKNMGQAGSQAMSKLPVEPRHFRPTQRTLLDFLKDALATEIHLQTLKLQFGDKHKPCHSMD